MTNCFTANPRLGFAPRSGNLAFEPAVLVSSIPSLSGIHFIHSVRKSAVLDYSGCRRSNVRPTPHGLKPYRKSASWICSVLRKSRFRTCGSCQLNSFAIRNSFYSFRPQIRVLDYSGSHGSNVPLDLTG